MAALLNAEAVKEWDAILAELRGLGEKSYGATVHENKALDDWLDRYAQLWVGDTMTLALSKIPQSILARIRRDTNGLPPRCISDVCVS